MPQMAPLSWTTLMLMFLALYLMNTIKLYFTNTYLLNNNATTKKTVSKTLSWKW